jgi:hypothetical protein
MMNLHYRHSVDDEGALAEFWSLTPEVVLSDPGIVVTLPVQKLTKWPSKAALRKLVWSTPMIHAAREIGISDVALRRRCVRLGVPLPPRGHWIKSENSYDQP